MIILDPTHAHQKRNSEGHKPAYTCTRWHLYRWCSIEQVTQSVSVYILHTFTVHVVSYV